MHRLTVPANGRRLTITNPAMIAAAATSTQPAQNIPPSSPPPVKEPKADHTRKAASSPATIRVIFVIGEVSRIRSGSLMFRGSSPCRITDATPRGIG